jgi:hypothetical protein
MKQYAISFYEESTIKVLFLSEKDVCNFIEKRVIQSEPNFLFFSRKVWNKLLKKYPDLLSSRMFCFNFVESGDYPVTLTDDFGEDSENLFIEIVGIVGLLDHEINRRLLIEYLEN